MSVLRISPLDERTTVQRIVSPEAPTVEQREIVGLIPRWMLSGGWGEPEQIIDYMRRVNSVPDVAETYTERDMPVGDLRVRFVWYDVDVRVERPNR